MDGDFAHILIDLQAFDGPPWLWISSFLGKLDLNVTFISRKTSISNTIVILSEEPSFLSPLALSFSLLSWICLSFSRDSSLGNISSILATSSSLIQSDPFTVFVSSVMMSDLIGHQIYLLLSSSDQVVSSRDATWATSIKAVILSLFEVFVHSNIGYADFTDGLLKRRAIFPIWSSSCSSQNAAYCSRYTLIPFRTGDTVSSIFS